MPKVALLFITIDNHNQPKIWNKFLKNNKYFNIYCHPKYPQNVTDTFLKNNIISNLAQTKWGHLVLAYYELLKAAYKNKDNYKFVFVSNSCIPVKSSHEVFKILTKDNATYVDTRNKMSKWDYEHRFKAYESYLKKFNINRYNYIKHSGWFSINREHVQILLDHKELFRFFNKIEAGDENFLTILKANHMKLQEKIITCVHWDQTIYPKYLKEKNKLWAIYDSTTDPEKKKQIKEIINKKKKKVAIDKSHPKSYKSITKKDIIGFKNDGCLFARKIDKDAKITVNFK